MANLFWSDIISGMPVSDYIKVGSSEDFVSRVEALEDSEPIHFGFFIDGSKKGIADNLIDYIFVASDVFLENYIEYMWVLSYGKYARFNAIALEKMLSYCSLSPSFVGAAKNEAMLEKAVSAITNNEIKLIIPSFFAKIYAMKRVRHYLDERKN